MSTLADMITPNDRTVITHDFKLMNSFVSIDPGLSNAVAILDQHANLLFATEIAPIGEGARKRLPLAGLVELIEQYHATHAVIEDVGAMPKQGIATAFRFGRATGSFEGVLSALKIPTTFIRPAVWKKPLGIAGATKEGARCLALQRWPSAAHFFPLKKHHNRAEAALLGAYYIERHHSMNAPLDRSRFDNSIAGQPVGPGSLEPLGAKHDDVI
jgi:crossover junction endodeoxyribonuclease RuvC